MEANITAVVGWLAPILSTLIICAGQLALNARFKRADEKRDAARADTDAKRKAEAEWRESVDKLLAEQGEALKRVADDRVEWYQWREEVVERMERQEEKLDSLTDGVQTTMRTDLIHLYEKFTTRGWITPEERAAWHDMYAKYSSLNANGLIHSYSAKLDELPDREID